MGPVHLDLPEDVAAAAATEAEVRHRAATRRFAPPPHAALDEASRLIARRAGPVAVIGASAMRMRDPGLLRQFIERHSMPFATTAMAKGLSTTIIRWRSAASSGRGARCSARSSRAPISSSALGYDTVEVEYEAWIGSTTAAPYRHRARRHGRLGADRA